MNTVTFVFEALLWNDYNYYILTKKNDAQKVADWFSSLNNWQIGEGEYESIKFEPELDNKIKCTFTTYESDIETLINGLIDPDDDGNYPIKFENQEYLCKGERV